MIPVTPVFLLALLGMVENSVIPTDDTNNRIFGGEKASITEFPSMAFLLSPASACGSTIISDRWILTAAHCVEGSHASDVTVFVGSEYSMDLFGGSVHQASKIIQHEEYVEKEVNGVLIDLQNDIALVEVEEPFPLNSITIKAARLPLQDEGILEDTIVTAVGWGRIEDDQETRILRKANLEIFSTQKCRRRMRITIDERNLCTSSSGRIKSICRGDSGGPLFNNDVVVGITSAGPEHCRLYNELSVDHTSIFTRVAYFRNWIKQNSGI